ncbi:MAG: hypothetical protein OXF39_08760 [Nitrospira sp.]|nr:hypothetical protein [Nitrospira sp.]
MSQSDEHRDLVLQVVEALENRYPLMTFIADVQKEPGDEVPPLIDGFRPDVYASKEPSSSTIIAEAKTARKIFSKHTNNQILAFVNYLERRKNGFFVLSVTGCGADSARTLLRFIRQGTHVKRTTLAVFDGCDFWLLDSSDGATWHLS